MTEGPEGLEGGRGEVVSEVVREGGKEGGEEEGKGEKGNQEEFVFRHIKTVYF